MPNHPNPKYELVYNDVTSIRDHGPLYRIRALRDFADIKKGELGGYISRNYIAGFEALSHDGDCWVGDQAKVEDGRVLENARLRDWARIEGGGEVSGNAELSGYATIISNVLVTDFARISGDACVHGPAVIGGTAHLTGEARFRGGSVTECTYTEWDVKGEMARRRAAPKPG